MCVLPWPPKAGHKIAAFYREQERGWNPYYISRLLSRHTKPVFGITGLEKKRPLGGSIAAGVFAFDVPHPTAQLSRPGQMIPGEDEEKQKENGRIRG